MRCIFSVYDFGQDKVRESLSFRECGTLRNRWSEDGHFLTPRHRHAVLGIIGARIDRSHDDEYMLKLRAYPSRAERQRTRFL